jgi:ankyrin repeat protein
MSRALLYEIKEGNTENALRLSSFGAVNGTLSPLIEATRASMIEVMRSLLDRGAEIDAVDHQDESACHVAIYKRHFEALELLISRGARIDKRDAHHNTPLCAAVALDNDRFAIALLDAGASLDRLDKYRLFCAASVSLRLLQRLLDAKVRVRKLRGSNNDTPCHRAVVYVNEGIEELLRALTAARVDVDAVDNTGDTACHKAARYNKPNALRTLIQLGADIHVKDKRGCTPLHLIPTPSPYEEKFEIPVLMLLLAGGADFHAVDNKGESAFHVAARTQRSQALCAFVAAGADLDLADSNGNTPRQLILARNERLPDEFDVDDARTLISTMRLDFVRERALEICIALHERNLDALQLCEIMVQACGPVARVVPFHQWWKIAVTVKHFRDKGKEKKKTRSTKPKGKTRFYFD